MLNAILLRVVLFLCARADENSRGKEVTRRERHKKGLLVVDDSLPPPLKKKMKTKNQVMRKDYAIQSKAWEPHLLN